MLAGIRSLPLRELVRLHRAIRRSLFTVPWPSGAPSIVIDHSPTEVDSVLRSDYHFESGVTLSYRYEDEVLNLRRPEGTRAIRGGQVQIQAHVRGRVHEHGWEYIAHLEPDPDEHPRLHINEVGFHWDRDWLVDLFEDAFDITPDDL